MKTISLSDFDYTLTKFVSFTMTIKSLLNINPVHHGGVYITGYSK